VPVVGYSYPKLIQSLQNSILWERRLAAIRAGGGAPTGYGLDLTSGEFQHQYGNFIIPFEYCSKIDFLYEYYATTR
jgi:hypothetical protein